MKTRTYILTALGILAAGSLGVVAFRSEPVPVDLAEITRGPMQVTVDVDGKTRIAEVYEVATPVTGMTRRAPVRVGDRVVAGETVVAVVEPAASNPLDPRSRAQAEAVREEAEAGLHVARSAMRQAVEELELAESEYMRLRALVDREVVSLTRVETAEQELAIKKAALTAAISRLEMSKSVLDRARAALIEPQTGFDDSGEDCCLRILAPADGRVLGVDVVSESPVLVGKRLLSIGQPSDLEIVADVPSTDVVHLSAGDRAIVERWGGGEPLEATITKIEPSAYTKISALGIEEQRVDIVFSIDTPVERRAMLGDGFSVYLRIIEWQSPDALQVPLSAMFRQNDGWGVFVEAGGAAELRQIKIGHQSQSHAEILDGLVPGDYVVLHPDDRVTDGAKIAERDAP